MDARNIYFCVFYVCIYASFMYLYVCFYVCIIFIHEYDTYIMHILSIKFNKDGNEKISLAV